jgi:hypothetical protein
MGNSKKKHIDLILEDLIKNQDKKLSNKLYKSYIHF